MAPDIAQIVTSLKKHGWSTSKEHASGTVLERELSHGVKQKMIDASCKKSRLLKIFG